MWHWYFLSAVLYAGLGFILGYNIGTVREEVIKRRIERMIAKYEGV